MGFSGRSSAIHASGPAVWTVTRVRAPAAAGRAALDQEMIEVRRVSGSRAAEGRPFCTDLAAAVAAARAGHSLQPSIEATAPEHSPSHPPREGVKADEERHAMFRRGEDTNHP